MRVLRCSLNPPEAAAALREHLVDHEVVLGGPDEIPALAAQADVIVPARFTLDGSLIRRATRCRLIQQMGAGVDGVDLDAARSQGIPVANAPASHTGNADSVAEMALWLVIACRRRLPELQQAIQGGDWSAVPVTQALHGATVCVVGYGAIGTRFRELLRPFRCRILGVKRTVPEVPSDDVELGTLEDLPRFLEESDAVVLCLPSSDETRGLVDDRFLARMRTGAVLVNVSRADLVDHQALVEALRSRRLALYGGDVFWTEPLDPRDPLVQLPTVLTPHVAGLTVNTLEGGARIVAENVRRLQAGEPLLHRVC